MGGRQNQRLVSRTGPHTRDIPRYKGYVTGARLSRQALQYHEYSKSFIAVRRIKPCVSRVLKRLVKGFHSLRYWVPLQKNNQKQSQSRKSQRCLLYESCFPLTQRIPALVKFCLCPFKTSLGDRFQNFEFWGTRYIYTFIRGG